jgi:prepilin-type N-terminal cleavage/methylation domain-containing protein
MTLTKTRRHSNSGFTLIELMIVVVIVAVLLVLVAPAFINVIRENQIRTQASRIVSSLNLARSTSAKENVAAMVCASADAATCSADENDFRKGWLVYVDRDSNGVLTVGGDELIRVYSGLPSGYFLVLENASTLGPFQITYYPDGSTSGKETIVTCPSTGDNDKAWSVIVGAVGSPRMKRPDSVLNCSS